MWFYDIRVTIKDLKLILSYMVIYLKMKFHFRFFLLHVIFRRTLQMKDLSIVLNPSTSDRHILL